MSSKKATSSSTTQTTTDQSIEDNRVVVSDEGIGIGKVELGKGSTYTQAFSPEVGRAFSGLIELTASAGEVAMGSVEQSIKASERTTSEFMKGLSEIQTGTTVITKILPFAFIGIGAMVLLTIFGRKK